MKKKKKVDNRDIISARNTKHVTDIKLLTT